MSELPDNKIYQRALTELTQTIAELRWWYRASPKDMAFQLGISVNDITFICSRQEYIDTVEKLMLNRGDAIKWINTYKSPLGMPKSFGRRMGLSEDVVVELIDKVKEKLHNV